MFLIFLFEKKIVFAQNAIKLSKFLNLKWKKVNYCAHLKLIFEFAKLTDLIMSCLIWVWVCLNLSIFCEFISLLPVVSACKWVNQISIFMAHCLLVIFIRFNLNIKLSFLFILFTKRKWNQLNWFAGVVVSYDIRT